MRHFWRVNEDLLFFNSIITGPRQKSNFPPAPPPNNRLPFCASGRLRPTWRDSRQFHRDTRPILQPHDFIRQLRCPHSWTGNLPFNDCVLFPYFEQNIGKSCKCLFFDTWTVPKYMWLWHKTTWNRAFDRMKHHLGVLSHLKDKVNVGPWDQGCQDPGWAGEGLRLSNRPPPLEGGTGAVA